MSSKFVYLTLIMALFVAQLLVWAARLKYGFPSFFSLTFAPLLPIASWFVSIVGLILFLNRGTLRLVSAPATYMILSSLAFIYESFRSLSVMLSDDGTSRFARETPYIEMFVLVVAIAVHLSVFLQSSKKKAPQGQ